MGWYLLAMRIILQPFLKYPKSNTKLTPKSAQHATPFFRGVAGVNPPKLKILKSFFLPKFREIFQKNILSYRK